MAEVVIDPLEVVDAQHRQQQITVVPVSTCHLLLQAFAEHRTAEQPGQWIGQGFLSLVLQIAAERLGILFHAVDPFHQRLWMVRHLLFMLDPFALVLVHEGE